MLLRSIPILAAAPLAVVLAACASDDASDDAVVTDTVTTPTDTVTTPTDTAPVPSPEQPAATDDEPAPAPEQPTETDVVDDDGAETDAAPGPSETGEPGPGEEEPFDSMGVCGERGQATVDASTYQGYLEYYIIGDEGFGVDICVVRFDVRRVGDAPSGCDDCLWTHLVEYDNPEVLLDEGGVCANSELGLDEAALGELAGTQVAVGFVYEYAGHNSVLMTYDTETETWEPNGNASWDEETGESRFDRRKGFCDYSSGVE